MWEFGVTLSAVVARAFAVILWACALIAAGAAAAHVPDVQHGWLWAAWTALLGCVFAAYARFIGPAGRES